MSFPSAQVETAFSFVELLNQTDRQRDELEVCLEGDTVDELVVDSWDDTERAVRIANATWVGRLIDSEMATTIESYLAATPLHVRRNAFAGTVTLATPGVSDGLRDKALKEQRASERYTVSPETYRAMLSEGVVEWSIRTASEDGYEVRQCAQCGNWFEPQLKDRSRFCSPKCRKTFNNVRNSGHDDLTNFTCGGCGERRGMDEFAGLEFEGADNTKTATPLRISRYRLANLCCVDCVRTRYPEWRRYIAPMESLIERASA
jgi:hypothetical protein